MAIDPWAILIVALLYIAELFGCVCVAAALAAGAAAVACRRARDEDAASRGIRVGTVLGWAVTVALGWAFLSGPWEWCCGAYLVGAAVAYGVARVIVSPAPVTYPSPDGTQRVWLVDQPVFLEPDRNFEVHLEEIGRRRTRVVSRRPEAGVPAGSERVVWSADGSRFLVLGRHFAVAERGALPDGERAYLMMDVRSGQVWCNAAEELKHPGFGVKDVRAVEWLGWAPADPPTAADRGPDGVPE